MPKIICLALTALLTVSSLLITSVHSEVTKPSIPDFTTRLVDNSYDVLTTYSTDPYTGSTITHPAHRVTNQSVELVIKNQPFVSTTIEGWSTSFFYNVRMKGHYGEDWLTLYNPTVTPYYAQLDSENTVISLPYSVSDAHLSVGPLSGLPLNTEIDFQVEALAGYVHRVSNSSATNPLEMFPRVFEGETSGWSSTQTLTICNNTLIPTPPAPPTSASVPPSQNPLATPFEPIVQCGFGLSLWQIATFVLGVLVILLTLVFFWRIWSK